MARLARARHVWKGKSILPLPSNLAHGVCIPRRLSMSTGFQNVSICTLLTVITFDTYSTFGIACCACINLGLPNTIQILLPLSQQQLLGIGADNNITTIIVQVNSLLELED